LSSQPPADAFLSNHNIIRQALEFYNKRLATIIESEEIKNNNFVRGDLSEYLKGSQSILADLMESGGDFNEWFRSAEHTLRVNEKLLGFVLSSYKKHLELSGALAIQKMNYEGLVHPDVKFDNLRRQMELVEQAKQYIGSSY
jgi:hypothetical protein